MSDEARDYDHARVPEGALVIGLDGSDRDETCIVWGAMIAARRQRPLHLLQAHDVGDDFGMIDPSALGGVIHDPTLVADDTAHVDRALALVRERWPEVEVTAGTPWLRAEQALIDASRSAYLIVVGSQPRSGLDRLLLGRTSLATVSHASCPVVIIPAGSPPDPQGPVMVGVDGSEQSALALARAFDIADSRGRPLVAVATWHVQVVDGVVVTTPGTPAYEQVVATQRESVERLVAPLRERHPGVEVEIRVVQGKPARTLVAEAADAVLLVVGSRGRGGFRGMLLGSVSHEVLERATCPVMVVRNAPRERG